MLFIPLRTGYRVRCSAMTDSGVSFGMCSLGWAGSIPAPYPRSHRHLVTADDASTLGQVRIYPARLSEHIPTEPTEEALLACD